MLSRRFHPSLCAIASTASLLALGACSQDPGGIVVIYDGTEELMALTEAPSASGIPSGPEQALSPAAPLPMPTLPGASAAPTVTPGASAAVSAAPPPEPTLPKGVNLIENGDFAAGDQFWRVDDGAGTALAHATAEGALCVTLNANQPHVVMSWPLELEMGLPLESAATYQLTYDAWSPNPEGVALQAKVGTATEPFMQRFAVRVGLAKTIEPYSNAFSSRSAETSGVLFEATWVSGETEVCLDNVSLKGL